MTQQKTSPQEHQSIPIFDFHPTPACNMHKVMDHAELLSDKQVPHSGSIADHQVPHSTLSSIIRMFKNASFNRLHCEYQQ